MEQMSGEERRRRSDAERNRHRLVDAAEELFRTRGLDVGVGEIAERAGVGRGTLFRNFPTKEDLIAAIVVERMHEAAAAGRELQRADDPDDALFAFLEHMAGAQQVNRGLFEAVADQWLANDEIRAGHSEIVEALEGLLARAQAVGAVRPDVGAMDLLFMLKGVCEAAAALSQVEPRIVERHLDLVRAALRPVADAPPLRGHPPTLSDIERPFADAEPRATKPATPPAELSSAR
jgi:AcrR family transcriptional regulator